MKRTMSPRIGVAVLGALWLLALVLPVVAIGADPAPPGPPFPDPVTDQAVYDYAGVFSETTIASAEATIAAIAGGIVVLLFAQGMPKVTMSGAMIRAMLAAYRRTLQKTMEQARSMHQVIAEAGLDWLETPDQAVVWATALGLQGEVEDLLKRSLEDVSEGRSAASATYVPLWYQTSNGSSFANAAASGSGGSIFSGSPVPDLGGMMSALGTIGNSPSSSGSGGGGGGFSGGSSGGGGGGSGGGF